MHIPVLYKETINYLRPQSGASFIDGTLGAGGHTFGLLEASAPDGRVLAFDRDPEAIIYVRTRLGDLAERVTLVQASFAQMADVAPAYGFDQVNGILLDLGLSSRQLADAGRGFSFQLEGPLDMRFDPGTTLTANEIVNQFPETDLADILWRYGEVRQSRRLAHAIFNARPIESTTDLVEVILNAMKDSNRRWRKKNRGALGRKRIHPATQVFQALRIAVNKEFEALEEGLEGALSLLVPQGRLAVITFHSLEDRIVKQFFRDESQSCVCPPEQPICTCNHKPRLRLVTRKVVKPSSEEIASNPRSRSAKLRVAERITGE